MIDLIYRNVYGIETGDLVRTSYGTGPHEVLTIVNPYIRTEVNYTTFIADRPMFSISGVNFVINAIVQVDNRWFTCGMKLSELFVEKPDTRRPAQFDMFLSYPEIPELYRPQPDVDYADTDHLWECRYCLFAFNGVREKLWEPRCPKCGVTANRLILVDFSEMTL